MNNWDYINRTSKDLTNLELKLLLKIKSKSLWKDLLYISQDLMEELQWWTRDLLKIDQFMVLLWVRDPQFQKDLKWIKYQKGLKWIKYQKGLETQLKEILWVLLNHILKDLKLQALIILHKMLGLPHQIMKSNQLL